jgi:hypothetical protein
MRPTSPRKTASVSTRLPAVTPKPTVLSLVERGGKIRSFELGGNTGTEIVATIRENPDPASTLHSDGAQVYRFTGAVAEHQAVDNSKEFVRQGKSKKVYTNTLEVFSQCSSAAWSETYQHYGEQHLQRYLVEFDFRANQRVKLGFDGITRADIALQGIVGKRLTYRRTHQA